MTWELEEQAAFKGFRAICGVDEAGRGPLAGPVCAGAVILPQGVQIDGLNDSKKLSEKKREALYDIICDKAISWSVALVDEKTIDRINILQATLLAMRQAVEGLRVQADFALIDGNAVPPLLIPCECIISGDARVPSIAAASILAKVTRDRLMLEYAAQYPQYGFSRHKGYGTKAHTEALLAHGACPIHRQSFLKKLYAAHPEAKR